MTVAIFAFAALVLWLRYAAFPHIDSYRDDIVSSIERASGMRVSVQAIAAGWGGLRPVLELKGVRIEDRRGKSAFQLERAEVQLAWWALFLGKLRFTDVDFYRPELALRRGSDGLVYLADKALNGAGPDDDGAFTDWLLSQPSLGIHDAVLTWRDEKQGAPEVRLSNVQIELRADLGRHRIALTAMPPPELSGAIDIRADVRLSREGRLWRARGQAYAEARNTDLGLLRSHLPLPETLRSGVGSVRVWAQFTQDQVEEVLADVAMRDARAQLADDSLPLELATLSGRARYRAQPTGFTFSTEDLRFRLPSGDEAQPGNFRVTRRLEPGKPPHAEVRADGIDLKIAATLLDYFPVPRDIKAQVVRFAPRGRLTDALLTWSGDAASPAKTYTLRGRFEDLAVNAAEPFPGVSGLWGEIEGTEAGGTLHVAGRGTTFELAQIFRAPLQLDTLEARARWKREGAALTVTVDSATFANADAAGSVAGTWRSLPDGKRHSPGYVDLHGKLTRANIAAVAKYMPNRLPQTREWLERSIRAGTSQRASFELRGDLFEFPFGDGSKGHFLVESDIHGGSLRYLADWPGVDAIEGTLRFENRRMEIRAASARIFASRVGPAAAVVEDLAMRPPTLTVDGDVETTGADTIRFLRESPLANGPGAFTRTVSVEGPARLRLHLDIPLAGTEPVRVAGDYQFRGATVTAAKSLTLEELQGRLSFTERGVRAPDLAGKLFGQPAQLALSSQAEGVVTSLQGRVDAATLAQYLPQAVAARTSGTTDWKARLVSGRAGNDLTVTSDLGGMAVTLPAPLAKSAEAPRALTIHIAQLGADNEVTTAVLDGDVHGRFSRAGDRWQAALRFGNPLGSEPVREGLWLYGELPVLDVDAWQSLFGPSDGAASEPAARPAVELRGLDLRMGRVRYLGREMARMHAQLARTGTGWSGRLESPLLAGDVQWNPQGKGRVVARLSMLAIPESSGTPGADPQQPQPLQGDLPAIDLAADRFDFRGHTLGSLALKAEPVGDEWQIERLDITADHARFHSTGGWRRAAGGSITTLQVKLDADNLNALLGQFGYGAYVKRGTGSLEGTLAWPGLPHEFALPNLAGGFKVGAEKGQFAKIEPGAGKVLGLLSLQSLPRRVTLDFRDIFSEGFAFDRIQGDVKVSRGVLLTDAFEIVGPAAFVSIAGEVSLPKETQALTMRVVPEVSEGVALAATVFGTPVLGLSTLLVTKLLKNPIGRVVAYEYHVTGSWDNPQVQRTSAPPPSSKEAQATNATPQDTQ